MQDVDDNFWLGNTYVFFILLTVRFSSLCNIATCEQICPMSKANEQNYFI